MVFDQNIKVFPASNADRILSNQRGRLNKDKFENGSVEVLLFKERKLFINSFEVNDHVDYHKASCFSNDGCISGTIESNGWHSKVTIDKTIIKKDIGKCFCQRTPHQPFRLISAYQ